MTTDKTITAQPVTSICDPCMLWQQEQLERGMFLLCKNKILMSEHAVEFLKLLQVCFSGRFQDMKIKQRKGNEHTRDTVKCGTADVPYNLQHCLPHWAAKQRRAQSNNNVPLIKFYKLFVRPEDFPILKETFTEVYG